MWSRPEDPCGLCGGRRDEHDGTSGEEIVGYYDGHRFEFDRKGLAESVVARLVQVDRLAECPVCRSNNPCGCDETDRGFTRRTRFEQGDKRTPRCRTPGCWAPLSVIYLLRSGAPEQGPWGLSHFVSTWGCALCSSVELTQVITDQEN